MTQVWDPTAYARDAGFVPELGSSVLELLSPQADERILDLGCGDGSLAMRIAEFGCEVVAVDLSPEMVAAAKKRGLDARVADGHQLRFRNEFDAVFSNAALHWMTRPDDVISGVFRALKPGGRFVGEFGGYGNIEVISRAFFTALEHRSLIFDMIDPWYCPRAESYRARLEAGGMRVLTCELFPRPTPLTTDIVAWLRMFGQVFLASVPSADRSAFLNEVVEACRPELCDDSGRWTVDYVRLRFAAVRS